jgi:hypothetical protein
VIQHESDGLGVKAGVQRIEHRSGHRHAEVGFEHRGDVRQHDRDGVASADAAPGQG